MTKVFVFLLSLIIAVPTIHAQKDEDGYTKEEIENKIKTFGNMRTTGIVMTCLGIGSLVTGIVLFTNAASIPAGTQMTDQEMNNQIAGLVTGWICMGVGIPVTIAGGVLAGIGNGKHNEYKNRLKMFGGYNYKAHDCYMKFVYCF